MFLKEQRSCHKPDVSAILIAFFAFQSWQVLKGESKLGSCLTGKPKQLFRKCSFLVLCLENSPSGSHTVRRASALDALQLLMLFSDSTAAFQHAVSPDQINAP